MTGRDAESGAPANAYFVFITRRAGWVVAATLLLGIAALAALVDFGRGELRLAVDPSLDPLIAKTHPDRLHYEQL